ncbi:MAG: Ubiquinol--cytochrome c reductase, cytochrome subunit, partial [Gammaproteobacteria bacterium]|nr:Ubiquinol--cytochrome c reductase, cytochrome subunit [Gammaproteobacteria bacterium]
PDGIEIKGKVNANGKPLDGIPFHPYYTVKDVVSVGVFLVLFASSCSSGRRSAASISFLALGYLGLQPAEGKYVVLARLFTVFYFAFFWLMPFYSKVEAVKAVPERVH